MRGEAVSRPLGRARLPEPARHQSLPDEDAAAAGEAGLSGGLARRRAARPVAR